MRRCPGCAPSSQGALARRIAVTVRRCCQPGWAQTTALLLTALGGALSPGGLAVTLKGGP